MKFIFLAFLFGNFVLPVKFGQFDTLAGGRMIELNQPKNAFHLFLDSIALKDTLHPETILKFCDLNSAWVNENSQFYGDTVIDLDNTFCMAFLFQETGTCHKEILVVLNKNLQRSSDDKLVLMQCDIPQDMDFVETTFKITRNRFIRISYEHDTYISQDTYKKGKKVEFWKVGASGKLKKIEMKK